MNGTMKRIEGGEFFLIAGPCAIESEQLCLEVAETVAKLADRFGLPYIFKSSYKKANRTSADSYRGPGLEEGLKVLEKVRSEFDIPVLTDVHLPEQTELVVQAAATGRWVNIKKGQFLAPDDMARVAAKANSSKVMLTERGSSFGYHNLVVDFRSLIIMRRLGYRVVFDATHSLQLPSGGGAVSTGQPEYAIPLPKAAVAVGIDGLFVETHPHPSEALCDAGVMLSLDRMDELLQAVLKVREASK